MNKDLVKAPAKVKIKSASKICWYKAMVGEEVEVVNTGDGKNFLVFDCYKNKSKVLKQILLADCEVIYDDGSVLKIEPMLEDADEDADNTPVENFAIVRNVQNNDLYEAHGNNKYTNLRTGASGEISEEIAKRVFAINLAATALIHKYPLIKTFIQKCQLKVDTVKN